MKITRRQLKRIIKEELDATDLSMTHVPSEDSHVDPRYTQSSQKAHKRHHNGIFEPSKEQTISQGRIFSDCTGPGIVLPYDHVDKDTHDLWNYIIDARGNRSLYTIAIHEMLGIEDLGIVGIKQWMNVAAGATGKFLKKWVPYLGQAELAHDIVNVIIEWNKNVEKGFCEVMQLMNQSYWGSFERRHIKMEEWMIHPGYLALIIHYGRNKGWTPIKIAQVMISAGWLHPNEANYLRHEILKAEILKIELKSQIDALEFEDSLEIEDDSVAIEV